MYENYNIFMAANGGGFGLGMEKESPKTSDKSKR